MLAVISDIHGNLPALEAVLSDIQTVGADELVCLGDVASFGPQPRETLRRVQALGCPVVMGNADWELLDTPTRETLKASDTTFFDIASWCAEQLTEEDSAFIRTFQPTVSLNFGALQLLCFHGSPTSYNDLIIATTPDETIASYLQERTPLMLGGHTHTQLLRRFQEVTFVNPGSVGLPYEWLPDDRVHNPPWAEYALLVVVQGQPSVTFRRVPYDVTPLVEAARTGGMPHAGWWLGGWLEQATP